MRFANRADAAAALADRLAAYAADAPLVVGVPRGGVPMAATIAQALGGDLDVVLVHKLRAPFQPELAIGAIDETGREYFTALAHELHLSGRQLEAERETQLSLLRQRRVEYTGVRPRVPVAGRTVIIVDDGLATGATALSAVRAARAEGARKVVVAAAVAPRETIARLREEADDVVCLMAPEHFNAVGEFFDDFSEVDDEAVVAALGRPRR